MKKVKFAFICFCFVLSLCQPAFTQQTKSLTKQQRLENTVYLQELNYSASVGGELCVIEQEDKTVRPHYSENTFYVPLRFVVEKLGGVVFWEDSVKTVILNIDTKRIALSTRYDTFSCNGQNARLEKSCFIKDGFTYVAFDDIAKICGFGTYFYNTYSAGVVFKGQEWNPERDAEKQALSAMEFAVSPFFKMFLN